MASRNQRRSNKKISNEIVESAQKKKTSTPIMWVISIVILVVIVVTFVGAPVAGKVSSHQRPVFGSYDGEELVYSEDSFFADQVYSIAENYRDSMNEQNSQFIQFQVWRAAFENAMFRTAIIKELQNSDVVISNKAIDDAIVTYGPYMENGEFSENLYAQSSNTEKKHTRRKFEEDLYYSQFLTDINSNTINLNEEKFFQDIASTEKKFKYVFFPFSDFPDEAVADYGTENSDLFREISVSKITINTDRKTAEQVLSKLKEDPGMFSELARTQSSDPYADKGGEMGSRYFYELKNLVNDDEAMNEIFSLAQGELSGIIEDAESWTIYRCDSAATSADMNLESDLSVVREYMQRYEKGIIEDYLVGVAESFAGNAKSSDFDEAGSVAGTEVFETNFFPVIYGNPSVYYYQQNIPVYTQPVSSDPEDALSGTVNNEFFLKSINKLDVGEVSDPLILNDNVLVLQLVDERERNREELGSVSALLTYAGQNWQSTQLRDMIFSSDKLVDNFSEVFAGLFLSN